MVTIITDKLRSQTLDDVQFEPILQQPGRHSWEQAEGPPRPGSGLLVGAPGKQTASSVTRFGKPEWHVDKTEDQSKHEAAESLSRRQASGPVSITLDTPPLCIHNKSYVSCPVCGSALPNTPPAPPMKRHCRSLSIPGDAHCPPASGASGCHGNGAKQKWQPQASAIWRPVAIRPHHHSNNKLGMKNRNSPLGLHKSMNRSSMTSTSANSSSPLGQSRPNSGGSTSGSRGGSTSTSQSPGVGVWSVASSDSFSTPPESPIPRPHSASSGFCDSSQGSLNVSWHDGGSMASSSCTGSGGANATAIQSTNCRFQILKVRSFSMEEPISATSVVVSMVSASPASSMPALPHHTSCSSTPSSPRRHRMPRCRSQPCVLHERKGGMKRRRDDDRPTLDLLKMKETAYDRLACRGRTKNVQFSTDKQELRRTTPSIFTEPPECFLGLNTIASSPLDSYVGQLASKAANMISTSPVEVAIKSTSSEQRIISSVSSNNTITDPLEADGLYHLSDSGCSDAENEPPVPQLVDFKDLSLESNDEASENLAFLDRPDDTNCGCEEGVTKRFGSETDQDNTGDLDLEGEEVFQIDMNNDLDIEQIEKD